jgi:hypothetical protein
MTQFDKWMQLGGYCDGNSDVLNVSIAFQQQHNFLTLQARIQQLQALYRHYGL